MQIRDWNMCGLPSDVTSSENGILTTKAERWGLCIDPQQQANKWLKAMYKSHNVKCLKFGSLNFLRNVIGQLKVGGLVIVEDVQEHLDPSIDPILLHQEFEVDGGFKAIKLGDKVEDYDPDFRLYLTTKMANPHYAPETCIKVTLINFTVTFQGLEEQLLGDVVIKERPEVEEKRDQIVLQMSKDQATLKEIENEILKLLNGSELEQILDEDTLIDILENSKVTSTEINERISQALVVQEEIAETRSNYKTVAIRGSILYFVIADMARINDMYQNSLQFVKKLFNIAIDQSEQHNELPVRLSFLIETITKVIFTNISRGLFERDKSIFSFLICTSIDRNSNVIKPMGWNIVLRGAQPLSDEQESKKPPNPLPKIVTDLNYDILYSSQVFLETFGGIIESFEENEAEWTKWANCAEPQL